MNKAQFRFQNDVKTFYLVASPKGLCSVSTKKDKAVPVAESLNGKGKEIVILKQAANELSEYFAGNRTTFSVELDIEGTPFQKRVWQQLQKIPYGKTVSYRDIASRIKSEKAFRAVGTANGKNPLCIVIPCHRVIAADGSLGGYSAGLDLKVKLLKLENAPALS